MAKMKKRRISWQASESSQVIGYKLYWAESGELNYDSKHVRVGNVTEIILPDDVKSFTPGNGPMEFGITSIDELENESDMVTLQAPYQFNIPAAPGDPHMETLEQFHTTQIPPDESDSQKPIELIKSDTSQKRMKTVSHTKTADDLALAMDAANFITNS